MTELILILATWRLTSLLNREQGPYNILGRLRWLIGIRVDDIGQTYGITELARMIMCPFCCSIWIGCGFSISYWLIPDITVMLAFPFALSGGAMIIEILVSKLD